MKECPGHRCADLKNRNNQRGLAKGQNRQTFHSGKKSNAQATAAAAPANASKGGASAAQRTRNAIWAR